MNVLKAIRDFLNNYGVWQLRIFCSKKAKIIIESVLWDKKRSKTLGRNNVLFGPATIAQGVKLSSYAFMQKDDCKVMGKVL